MSKKRDINFDLKQLRSFLTVLEENSFTRASRKLKVGQATISHHIQQLEEMLGVSLIERTSKSFSITPEGTLFKKYAEKQFRDLEKLQEEMNRDTFRGTIRIVASTIPAAYVAPKIIGRIMNETKEMHFIMETFDSREAIEQVKEGRADIGIAGRELKHPSLAFESLCSDEIILIGPASAPDSLPEKKLTEIPLITRENGSGTRNSYENFLHSRGILPSDLSIVYEATTPESIKEAVIAGLGYAFMSGRATEKEMSLDLLKKIKVRGLPIKRDFYLVWQKNRKQVEPVVRLFRTIAESL